MTTHYSLLSGMPNPRLDRFEMSKYSAEHLLFSINHINDTT